MNKQTYKESSHTEREIGDELTLCFVVFYQSSEMFWGERKYKIYHYALAENDERSHFQYKQQVCIKKDKYNMAATTSTTTSI